MKKLAFALLCTGSLVLAACGGDDEPPDVADASTADSGPTGTCNPVTQSGCDAGEKCAHIVERADDPETSADEFLGRTACVPDGDKQAGEECSTGEAGPMGYDDCAAGYACNGTCVAICDVPQQMGCEATSGTCVLYEHNFGDVGDGTTVGLCAPSCDVVTQTMNDDAGDPSETECPDATLPNGDVREGACYLQVGLAVTSCATTPGGAAGATQGKPCFGPESAPDRCYLNGCAGGYIDWWIDPTMSQPRALCTAYCAHVDTYRETAEAEPVGDAAGDEAVRACKGEVIAADPAFTGPYTCRNLQSYIGFLREGVVIPEGDTRFDREWGLCAGAEIEESMGACSDLIKDAFVEAHDGDGTDDDENYCLAAEDLNEDGMLNDLDVTKCPIGCVSSETYAEWFSDMAATAEGRERLRKLVELKFTDKGIMVNGLIANGTAGIHR